MNVYNEGVQFPLLLLHIIEPYCRLIALLAGWNRDDITDVKLPIIRVFTIIFIFTTPHELISCLCILINQFSF